MIDRELGDIYLVVLVLTGECNVCQIPALVLFQVCVGVDSMEVFIARSMPSVTTITRICPPILSWAITCSWKCTAMISALSRMAYS